MLIFVFSGEIYPKKFFFEVEMKEKPPTPDFGILAVLDTGKPIGKPLWYFLEVHRTLIRC